MTPKMQIAAFALAAFVVLAAKAGVNEYHKRNPTEAELRQEQQERERQEQAQLAATCRDLKANADKLEIESGYSHTIGPLWSELADHAARKNQQPASKSAEERAREARAEWQRRCVR
jgi:hypothetical protein